MGKKWKFLSWIIGMPFWLGWNIQLKLNHLKINQWKEMASAFFRGEGSHNGILNENIFQEIME